MKLIKKLLPIGAIASVASIVAPITVSCASQSTYNVRDLVKNGYKRQTAVLPATTKLESKEGIKYLLKGIEENPQIVVDGIIEQIMVEEEQTPEEEPIRARRFRSWNPVWSESDARIKVSDVSANAEKGTISLTVSIEGKIVGYSYNVLHDEIHPIIIHPKDRVEYKGHSIYKIKNFSIGAQYTEDTWKSGREIYHLWEVYPNYKPLDTEEGQNRGINDLRLDKDWSVEIISDWDVTSYGSTMKQKETSKYTCNSHLDKLKDFAADTLNDYVYSMYLRKIIPTDIKGGE